MNHQHGDVRMTKEDERIAALEKRVDQQAADIHVLENEVACLVAAASVADGNITGLHAQIAMINDELQTIRNRP